LKCREKGPDWAFFGGSQRQSGVTYCFHVPPAGDFPAERKKAKKLMASDRQNLQDAFLNHVRKTKVPVTIFLINGVKLQGVITWFDNFCVLLRRDGQSQLVYKHAISTIMPAQPISLYEGEE
jgi:host factor-I protein